MLWVLNLLSLSDCSLTFLTLFLDEKKKVLEFDREKNFWVRYLLKKYGLSSRLFLVIVIITQVLVTFIALLMDDLGLGFMLGLFVMVNILHYFNLKTTLANWNCSRYWLARRIALNAKKI